MEIGHSFADLFCAKEEVNHIEQIKVLKIGVIAELTAAVRHSVVAGWCAV